MGVIRSFSIAAGHALQKRTFVHARSADSTARTAVIAIAMRSSNEMVVRPWYGSTHHYPLGKRLEAPKCGL